MCCDFTPFVSTRFQICDPFFPLLFSKDSKNLKSMDIGLREVVEKRRLNGTSKVNRRTDKQTDGRTFRLIESIGPEGRCFENKQNYILRNVTHICTWLAKFACTSQLWCRFISSNRSQGSQVSGKVVFHDSYIGNFSSRPSAGQRQSRRLAKLSILLI